MEKGKANRREIKSAPWRLIGLAALVIMLMLGAGFGCGGSNQTTTADKPTLIFGDYSWDSSLIHNRIAAFIIEKGYGYPVDYTFGDTLIILQGIEKGDVDVSMETWVDNIQEAYNKSIDSGKVQDLGANFPDAPQGWYVPAYLVKGDAERGIKPLAPDLKKVSDLPKYWQLFKDPENPNKGRFYNGPAGWLANTINQDKLKAYGLTDNYDAFAPGSDPALATSIASAYEKGQPWFGYYWEPTWIMGKYDMIMLEEPPYNEEQWNKDYGCAYPPAKVTIVVNSELEKKAPEVVQFLQKYETTLEQNNTALAFMAQHGSDAKKGAQEAAIWFLKQYPEHWQQWVSADTASLVEKALAEVK